MSDHNVLDLRDSAHLQDLLKGDKPCVFHFWTAWSEPCKQINDTLTDLCKEYNNCLFVKVEAETLAGISLKYEIIAVPTVIFIKGGHVVGRVDGVHVPDIVKKTRSLNEIVTGVANILPTALPKKDLNIRLKELLSSSHCVLFMKGNRQEPQCGFSRQMIGILEEETIDFSTFDILKDEEVRQGLKKFSNWPTYPQLYVNGELIGGLDIVKELRETGELKSTMETS